MSMQNHINRLIKEHRELDQTIEHMESTGHFDDDDLQSKKRQRLHLRDEIERLRHLDPSRARPKK